MYRVVVFLVGLALIAFLAFAIATCNPDGGCEEASRKANYSDDFDEMAEGMDYFSRKCTWRDGKPVAK